MEVKIVSHKEYRLHPITTPVPLGWTWAEWVRGWREVRS
jgi:hypothetical protein